MGDGGGFYLFKVSTWVMVGMVMVMVMVMYEKKNGLVGWFFVARS